MAKGLTILVGGMMASVPYQGGWTWAILQYLLGFRKLGHDVYFVEPLKQKALRPTGMSLKESLNAAYFRQVTSDFGFEQHSALVLEGTDQSIGLPYEELRRVAHRADILVNVSGILNEESLTADIPIRVYLDLDPVFTQLWQAAQHIDLHLDGHSHFVTIGLAIGQPNCNVPTCGLKWIPTMQPIVLDYWPPADGSGESLTTVANWRGYGSIEHKGVFYGQKAHSLRQFISLPLLTDEKFVLALAIHQNELKDLADLKKNGWRLVDPAEVAATPALYQRFVQRSKAEFGIVKSGYVAGRCGWFSDRSICYLASGRPVLTQETGFSAFMPTREGLFACKTQDDVLDGIEALRSDYRRHSRAARTIAEQYFDSGKVLSALLQRVGAVA
jgi:hypothetical protein